MDEAFFFFWKEVPPRTLEIFLDSILLANSFLEFLFPSEKVVMQGLTQICRHLLAFTPVDLCSIELAHSAWHRKSLRQNMRKTVVWLLKLLKSYWREGCIRPEKFMPYSKVKREIYFCLLFITLSSQFGWGMKSVIFGSKLRWNATILFSISGVEKSIFFLWSEAVILVQISSLF